MGLRDHVCLNPRGITATSKGYGSFRLIIFNLLREDGLARSSLLASFELERLSRSFNSRGCPLMRLRDEDITWIPC